MAAETCS